MRRRALIVAALVAVLLAQAGAVFAAPNADEFTASVESGQVSAAIAAAVIAAGVAGLGIVILQRFLHSAVRAS